MTRPAYVEILIHQGGNYSSNIRLTDSATNSYINIASSSFGANLKKSHYTSNVSASFICTKLDSANGLMSISLGYTTTANLESGRYVYDVLRTNGTEKTRIQEGVAIVTPKVT